MNKRDVLTAVTFGQRIAEDEADALSAYFVETDQWRETDLGQCRRRVWPKGLRKEAPSIRC